MSHISGARCHLSGGTCQVSHVTSNSQTVRGRELKFCEKVPLLPLVSCHMSCVMCHMSCVTCHMSLFLFTKECSYSMKGLLSTGPTLYSLILSNLELTKNVFFSFAPILTIKIPIKTLTQVFIVTPYCTRSQNYLSIKSLHSSPMKPNFSINGHIWESCPWHIDCDRRPRPQVVLTDSTQMTMT